ncbi:MAG TPA: sulfatase-like hydrolase/transferase [Vicinamibacterales bacterium]|nr:sulfatase-like hydrolase/transferase [Vicinamibacterales bacterium]
MIGVTPAIAGRPTRPSLLVFGLVAVAAAAGAAACGRPREAAPVPIAAAALRGSNVLLVTIDTLRADHVGAYGSTRGLTPTLDQFAAEGLRFAVAHAHVPMTLPSHATIMSGLYPPGNGVRDNGAFRFDRKQPTLASALASAGYRTAAFVGSFVLDARFGLNAGFDLYDDRLSGSSANLEIVQRTAEQVLAPAQEWIIPAPSPWFVWAHLYDPHEPYTPPEPYASRYLADPYSGEIAYADAALGTFLARLRTAHALEHTLVVIASDHGESLGEHGERTHGLFAYESTLRVPLIFWAPPAIPAASINVPARLVDIMPTVLDLVGVTAPAALDGRSLRGAVPGDDPGSYFEALNANFTRNWAPLKGIVSRRRKLIDLPIPELYDLSVDPGEAHNLYAARRDDARDLESRLDRVAGNGAKAPAPVAIDPDADARLRSLGYIVRPSLAPARKYTSADDPKQLVHLNAALDDAAATWARGDAPRAIAIVRDVLGARPDLTVAYDRLALMLRTSGHLAEAIAVADGAARDGRADRPLLRSLGSMYTDAGDYPRALAILEPLARQDESDVETLDTLAQAYARSRRGRDAEATFRKALVLSPNAAATWSNLGALYLLENRAADSIEALTRAVAINPDLATAHNVLGVAYARVGNRNRAVEEWRRALALRPDFADARANLQRIGAR